MTIVPEVSVIIPAFRVVPYVAASVGSVLAQNLAVEVIVVDEGNRDDSGQEVRRVHGGDDRVRVVANDRRGLCGARNTGLLLARGEWVMFLDGDDQLRPGALEELLSAARSRFTDGLVATAGRFWSIDESGVHAAGIWEREMDQTRQANPGNRMSSAVLLEGNANTPPGAILVRRSTALAVGGWDEGKLQGAVADDLEFLIRVVGGGEIGMADLVVLDYLQHSGSLSKKPGMRSGTARAKRLIIRRSPRSFRWSIARAIARRHFRQGAQRLREVLRGPWTRTRMINSIGNLCLGVAFIVYGAVTMVLPDSKLKSLPGH
jgi:glycosyltransferase involved in cell wall biosynthesis